MTYRRTEHWMNAKYPGWCAKCRAEITPGDRILFSTGFQRKRTVCKPCGYELDGLPGTPLTSRHVPTPIAHDLNTCGCTGCLQARANIENSRRFGR